MLTLLLNWALICSSSYYHFFLFWYYDLLESPDRRWYGCGEEDHEEAVVPFDLAELVRMFAPEYDAPTCCKDVYKKKILYVLSPYKEH